MHERLATDLREPATNARMQMTDLVVSASSRWLKTSPPMTTELDETAAQNEGEESGRMVTMYIRRMYTVTVYIA